MMQHYGMRKVLIKSRETGQELTQCRVPAKVSASLLQCLTNLVTAVEHVEMQANGALGSFRFHKNGNESQSRGERASHRAHDAGL